jgi:hypothetical protein
MKKFLLLAGQHYYPGAGTQDWIGTFETKEEAESHITKTSLEYKGRTLYTYKVNNIDPVDWYEIVDLEEWMNK